jgi:5-methylcytosine-specific restriction endonuclease McrA
MSWFHHRRSGRERRAFRARVFERDRGICEKCSEFHENWQVHHVQKLRDGGRWNDMQNVVTVCPPCHVRIHSAER